MNIETIASTVDQELAETSGLVDALIFLEEEGEGTQRLRDAKVSLLYVITDKLRSAGRELSRLSRFAGRNSPGTPCD